MVDFDVVAKLGAKVLGEREAANIASKGLAMERQNLVSVAALALAYEVRPQHSPTFRTHLDLERADDFIVSGRAVIGNLGARRERLGWPIGPDHRLGERHYGSDSHWVPVTHGDCGAALAGTDRCGESPVAEELRRQANGSGEEFSWLGRKLDWDQLVEADAGLEVIALTDCRTSGGLGRAGTEVELLR
jgi:hypothetical protein